MFTLVTIRLTELSASKNLLNIIVPLCNGNGGGIRGAVEVVAICGAEFAKEDLHRLGSLEGEPRVGAIVSELAGQSTKNETAKHASISRSLRVTLAVRETPCGEVEWSVIRSKESVSPCQSDGVAENGAAYGISCTYMMSQVKRKWR